jgi:hypothetical protein
MDKQQLLHSVKSWIGIDDDIRELQRELRAKRKEKRDLTETLVTTMKSHDIDCFELGQGNKLLYTQHKIKKPLSKKHLLTCLTSYFSGSAIDAQNLGTYIMNSRQVNIKDKIKRKTTKKK